MLDMILAGFAGCFTPINLLAVVFSVILGILVGALPGFGAATGLILILPLTYSMDPGTAFVALTGVYVGAEYGGSISSILLNTPGTGGAVVTCFDGFPMAQQGKAREALFISNIASFSGGIIAGLVMLFCMPLLGDFVLRFGAGEIFVLAVIGLLLVGSISQGDSLKGIASAAIGVLMTCIGADPFMGNARLDFDIPILIGGLPFIPVMLGVFSVPHLLSMILKSGNREQGIVMETGTMRENTVIFLGIFRKMYGSMKMLLARSGIIGVLVGMVPGVGGSVATMVAYSSAKRASAQPEKFGKGSAEGIAAPECSNNGLVGGSLIPVLALGIPGSPAAAIFMGAIFLHGMTPGPNFLSSQGNLVYMLIIAVFLAAFVQLLLGLFSIGWCANILKVPAYRLFPVVLMVCCIGAYVVRGLEFDIWLFSLFGMAAYFLTKMGFNSGAFILGMILGSITERSMMEALTLASAQGSILTYFMGRTIAVVITLMTLCYLAWRMFCAWRRRGLCAAAANEEECVDGSVGKWSGLRGYDTVYSLVLMGISLFFYTQLEGLGESTVLFPHIVLSVIMVCMAGLFIKTVFWGKIYAGRDSSPFEDIPWKKLFSVFAVWIVYLEVISLLGFYTASFGMLLVLCALLFFLSGERITPRFFLMNIVFVCIAMAVAYAVFKILFQVNTPSGVFL